MPVFITNFCNTLICSYSKPFVSIIFTNVIFENKFIPNFRNDRILKLQINGDIENNIVTLSEKTKTRILDEIGIDIINDGHPGFQAHKLWANGIVEFLNNKYL